MLECGWSAVEIIQYTGNSITARISSATTVERQLRLAAGAFAAAFIRTGFVAVSVVVIVDHFP
ncbi:hypothetical protein GCM10010417_48970 [Streptomyces carpaticus]